MRVLIKGGRVACGNKVRAADLLIEDGGIAQIGEALSEDGAALVDATGCVVLPGAIDTHTHLDLDVGGTITADDFNTGTKAAILGGTTTILDFATQEKGHTLQEAYAAWRQKMEGKAHCDVGFHIAITDWAAVKPGELSVLCGLGVTSFKLYMAYPDLMVEDDVIYAALRGIREVGGIAGFHCENGRLVKALVAQQKREGRLAPSAHPLSRPPEVEAEAIARLLRIAQLADAPVNIVHVSSELGMEAIRSNHRPDQRVFVETCPQYLLLTDRLYDQEDGAKYICSPPLRKKSDCDALWKAIASGEIHTIGTDHCSFRYVPQKAMHTKDFSLVPNGLPGIEHRLVLLMTEGVEKGRISLSQLVQVLSEMPARLFGLYPRKGVLAVGSDADVVIWDPSKRHTIHARTQAQNVDYTPYENMRVLGGVRDVWLRGRAVVAGGRVSMPFQGEYLHRSAPFAKKK